MAALLKCDQCGKTGKDPFDFVHIRAFRVTSATTFRSNAIACMDVCKNCYEKNFNKEEE